MSSVVVELASPGLEASLISSVVFDLFAISSSLVFNSSAFFFLAFVLSSGLKLIYTTLNEKNFTSILIISNNFYNKY